MTTCTILVTGLWSFLVFGGGCFQFHIAYYAILSWVYNDDSAFGPFSAYCSRILDTTSSALTSRFSTFHFFLATSNGNASRVQGVQKVSTIFCTNRLPCVGDC